MNWKNLIADLQARGLSQPQIAAACECGQATISDLARGRTEDPRDSLGQALRALHAQALAGCIPGANISAPQPEPVKEGA